jgi:preprotein translocase subunit SecG
MNLLKKWILHIYICVCVCVCVCVLCKKLDGHGKGNVIKKKKYMILRSGHILDNLLDFEPVNERICKIWVK